MPETSLVSLPYLLISPTASWMRTPHFNSVKATLDLNEGDDPCRFKLEYCGILLLHTVIIK